jgi:hypothetical protein
MKFLEQLDNYELINIILDERIEAGNVTLCMGRCPYDLGKDQEQCSKYEDAGDYCWHTLIRNNGKGYCEISSSK